MITIKSFYPFQGLLRVTQDFHEKKIIVKIKSLTYENEFDFEYKDIGEISTSYSLNHSQISFGFWFVLTCPIAFAFLGEYIYANLALFRIWQLAYVVGVFLCIAGYKKSTYIEISSKKSTPLTFFKPTSRNQEAINQAINIIRKNTDNLHEVSVEHPFPDEDYIFEHTEFDLTHLASAKDRFYEDKIIGSQKSFSGSKVYLIMYNQLNGSIYREKTGIDIAGRVISTAIFLLSLTMGVIYSFDVNIGSLPFLYFMYTLLTLAVISTLLKLVKRETIGLFDKNGNIAYWALLNKKNKGNIEKALAFVQSNIPANEKE